ncbi:MAG TPA: hypothetical protein PKM21_16075 [Anaerolineales bacterium]|nr:hypothetical protein [Anaerolineales bacterium]
MSEDERRQILAMIENGTITAEQGLELMKAIGDETEKDALPESATGQPAGAQGQAFAPQPEERPRQVDLPSAKKWRRWWWVPMAIGVTITVLASVMMYLSIRSSGYGFWFACSWFPFLLGVVVMALAWTARTARWLHVRIQQKEGEKPQRIAFSLPIPLRLTAWFLRTFKGNIHGMENTNFDEVVLGLEHLSPDEPFHVEVDEGPDGERVEVYIG